MGPRIDGASGTLYFKNDSEAWEKLGDVSDIKIITPDTRDPWGLWRLERMMKYGRHTA